MRLEWKPRAVSDLEQILTYIAKENPSAASRVAERITATVDFIKVMPRAGRYQPRSGSFIRVVTRLPFLIVYSLNEADDLIEIIAVFHTSRDPNTRPGA